MKSKLPHHFVLKKKNLCLTAAGMDMLDKNLY